MHGEKRSMTSCFPITESSEISKTDFMAWFPNGAPSKVRSDTWTCWAFSIHVMEQKLVKSITSHFQVLTCTIYWLIDIFYVLYKNMKKEKARERVGFIEWVM